MVWMDKSLCNLFNFKTKSRSAFAPPVQNELLLTLLCLFLSLLELSSLLFHLPLLLDHQQPLLILDKYTHKNTPTMYERMKT